MKVPFKDHKNQYSITLIRHISLNLQFVSLQYLSFMFTRAHNLKISYIITETLTLKALDLSIYPRLVCALFKRPCFAIRSTRKSYFASPQSFISSLPSPISILRARLLSKPKLIIFSPMIQVYRLNRPTICLNLSFIFYN